MTRLDAPPSAWTATLLLVGGLTVVRVLALFFTPLELYPDEAQYWLWSRTLDLGYYSKPPMVAWLIALTTGLGGDEEAWVRLAAPFLHGGAALALADVGRRLFGGWAGFWSAALYSLMPGVQLSSAVIATDAPLLFFLSLALLAYVALLQDGGWKTALALGAALGFAALSKYAAVYFLLGLVLHAALSPEVRRAWTGRRLGVAALALLAVLGPNLVWNALNGFQTVSHTAANANWDGNDRYQLASAAEFLGEQFGVFGPLPFLVLLVGLGLALAGGRRDRATLLLLCFAVPPLLIVTGQAFLSRANANWGVVAYAPAAVLVAGWLAQGRGRWVLAGAAASQGVLATVFLVGFLHPPFADALGLGNGMKRARGWAATTDHVLDRASADPRLTAIAVDDRFLFNAMAYYGRNRLPEGPPLVMWVREATPQNEAESTRPLTGRLGARVLIASLVEDFRPEIRRDFARTAGVQDVAIPLDAKRTRGLQTFVAEGYAPQPRDPRTGLPISRPTPP